MENVRGDSGFQHLPKGGISLGATLAISVGFGALCGTCLCAKHLGIHHICVSLSGQMAAQ